MGVHGLWRLLDASGKAVPLETLEGKVLAIDVSIWIHQVLQGYQDGRGNAVPNAHLLGLFHRICKLLYFKIKPVFVFDGGVPMLKKNTIASRKKQKAIAASKAQRMKNDLIQNLIKHTAIKGALGSTGGENSGSLSQGSSSALSKNSSHDMFKLPSLPADARLDDSTEDYEEEYDSESSVEMSPRKQARWKGNIHTVDVTSADFRSLPADVRYDVLTDLKETRKQNSWGRLHEMPEESHQFSNFQMERLLKRRRVQESLETAEKEMGGKSLTLEELEKLLTDQGVEMGGRDTAYRIASDSTTRLIFINDPKGLKVSSTDQASCSQDPDGASQSGEPSVSQDSGNENASFATDAAESVVENIHEYDLADSDWESENDAMVPAKSVEPSPLLTKRYFGKHRFNPALAYMLENAGLPQEQILALIEGDKQKLKSKPEETISLVSPETTTAADEDDASEKKKACSTNLFPDCDPMETSRIIDIEEPSSPDKSSLNDQVTEVPPENLIAKNDSVLLAQLVSSDSDSDLVEIQDVPIPESNFGLEITVNSNQSPKFEDDMFADVFTTGTADISDPSTRDISSASDSTMSLSFQNTNETTPTKKEEIASPIPVSSESNIETINVSSEVQIENPVKDYAAISLPEESTDKSLPSTSSSRAEELIDTVAKFKPELLKANREKLASMEAELESEHNDLTESIGKLERQATAVTDQMRIEAQDLLRLFGIPYIVAPMEAEAQCAHLESIRLTDGTITDDSDIWLFGGGCVYKNFFNNNKRVMQYKSSDIEHHFKLSRQQMIQLALLVGSDYTVGVSGIGPVTALEILAAFPSEGDNLLHGLTSFCSWIRMGRSAGPGRTGLRTKLRNVEIERGFPSQAVVQAYLFPTVDESKEAFTWSKPNLTLLADYTRQKFGWTKLKFEETIGPVVKKLAEFKSQKGIGAYFSVNTVPKSIETALSKRVKKAVERLGAGGESSNDVENADEARSPSGQSGQPGKRQGRGRVKVSKNRDSGLPPLEEVDGREEEAKKVGAMTAGSEGAKGSVSGASVKRNGKNVDEYIPQREKDKANALKKKLCAIEVFRKSKKGPGRTKKTKRPAPSIMKEAALSESSDSS